MGSGLWVKTYEMAADPVPRFEVEEYIAWLTETWHMLLDSGEDDESMFQDFLEQHPSLLPRIFGGHGPLHGSVISQPELPGFRAKRPDFMWIAKDSSAITAHLIEIESPSKRWATDQAVATQKFMQALDQLREWKAWFAEPHNVLQFRSLYGISDEILTFRQFDQFYTLIIGRRDEATASKAFAKKRALMEAPDETHMTYDRLEPDRELWNIPTIKLDRSGADTQFRLMHVPASFSLGPSDAADISKWIGREDAIRRNPLLSEDRKEFIISRLAYWDKWAAREQRRCVIGSELE
jgi:hypothetical protein